MKWLSNLEYYNIPFNIKIVNKNDCIIADRKINEHKIFYILDGFIQEMQVFTNGEIISLKLLYNNDSFKNIQPDLELENLCLDVNYHHRFKALTNTILIVVNKKELIKQTNNGKYKANLIDDIENYKKNEMLCVLSHRNTKKRLIQLLLILTKHFGVLTKNEIYIPFNISHSNIATIIGSQRITVNRIMKKFKPDILYYDDKQIIIFNIIRLIQS